MQCTKLGVGGVTSYSSWTAEEARLPFRDAEDHKDRRGVSRNGHILCQHCYNLLLFELEKKSMCRLISLN